MDRPRPHLGGRRLQQPPSTDDDHLSPTSRRSPPHLVHQRSAPAATYPSSCQPPTPHGSLPPPPPPPPPTAAATLPPRSRSHTDARAGAEPGPDKTALDRRPFASRPRHVPPSPDMAPYQNTDNATSSMRQPISHPPEARPPEAVFSAPPYYPPPPPTYHPLQQADMAAMPQLHHMAAAPAGDHSPYGAPYQQPQHYGPPMTYYAPWPSLAAPSGQPQKKKNNRASNACERCRHRKSRCDESKPTCSTCSEGGFECVYRITEGKSSDKIVQPALLEQILELTSGHNTKTDLILEQLGKLQAMLKGTPVSPQSTFAAKIEDLTRSRTDTPAASSRKRDSVQYNTAPLQLSHTGRALSHGTLVEDKAAAPPSNASGDFVEHTTAAHKLLYLWPSIHRLLPPALQRQAKANYVVRDEARGCLRLQGQGEGPPARDALLGDDLHAHFDRPDDDPTRSCLDIEPTYLDRPKIIKLLTLYCHKLHILHPIIDMSLVQNFIEDSWTHLLARAPSAANDLHPDPAPYYGLGFPSHPTNTNSKKRKLGDMYAHDDDGDDQPFRQHSPTFALHHLFPKRSLLTAITLLVLAIGSVCELETHVPGPIDRDTGASMQPPNHSFAGPASSPAAAAAAAKPSPASSTTRSAPAPTPESMDGARLAHSPARTRNDSPASGMSWNASQQTNEARIPGLSYYRQACSILGLFTDSNELALAQARILAGLYKGLLGRVQESWSWIYDACRICRMRLDRGHVTEFTPPEPPYTRPDEFLNTLLLVSWSALQLESDILAELDYPHSGIADAQDSIPYPFFAQRSASLDGQQERQEQQEHRFRDHHSVLGSYLGQLYIRKRLNDMHAEIYDTKLINLPLSKVNTNLDELYDQIKNFRSAYAWDDDEPPSSDILQARIRAKHYGANYICTRPYLDYVLHAMDSSDTAGPVLARDAYGNERKVESALFSAMKLMPETMVRARAVECVQTAIQSTIAFDGIRDRLIVTNIVGTSHAQFSNMLILSAAYHSGLDFLQQQISEMELRRLFARTINFIGRVRYCSPTAVTDVTYLQEIHKQLFPTADTPYPDQGYAHTNASSQRFSTVRSVSGSFLGDS